MRAVWSFWSKPYAALPQIRWRTERDHLMAWGLSVLTARQHYPETVLVADERAADVLINRLQLPFTDVMSLPGELADQRADLWVLGKLYAYAMQRQPFVHIDTDVFLWQPLPADFEQADMFAQNPEVFDLHNDAVYRPSDLDYAISLAGGSRTNAWGWAMQIELNQAINCGIFGGSRMNLIQSITSDMISFVTRNRAAWDIIGDMSADNVTLEQYLLAAYIALVKAGGAAGFQMRYLFNSLADAFNPDNAAAAGYTHLIGDGKRRPETLAKLEARVRRDHPDYYARCNQVLASWKGWESS